MVVSKPRLRRLRARLLAPAVTALAALLGRLPRRAVQSFGAAVGGLTWLVSRRDRRRTLVHLALAFPDRTPAERTRLARGNFRHHGVTLAETLHLLHGDCATVGGWVADVEGWNRVRTLRAGDRPILILTGHCGNWELLAALINCRGLGMSVVARRLDEPEFQALLLRLRGRYGTDTIERGEEGAARRLLRTFRGGGTLGMLIDQDIEADGVWVPFFGEQAHTPVGAARLALKFDAAVVPTFIERKANGLHRAVFHPELELPDDEVEATAVMTRAIEEQVRRVPEQWVWMHRRWRRRPPGEGAVAPEL